MTNSLFSRRKDSENPGKRAGVSARLLDGFSSLRAKLVLPYMLLTLILAFLGIFVVTRLVTSSVRERFVNQLYEAGRVSADGVVRQEREQLSSLRLMVFTLGVPGAVRSGSTEALIELLRPLALNDGLEAVMVLDEEGREVVSMVRSSETDDFTITAGSSFAQYDFVQAVLQGGSDEAGDKYVGVVETSLGPYLLTSAPVQEAEGETVGAVLAGISLDSLARDLKTQSLADIFLLDQGGTVLSTTMPPPDEGFEDAGVIPVATALGSGLQLREFDLFGRPYQAAFSPWIARGEVLGNLGVILPSNFVVSAESTSRNLFSLIFAVGTIAVFAIGYVISQNIAVPILQLRTMAQAVAGGDLEQVSGLRRSDEIGDLAEAFDTMTSRLSARTEEAKRLYEETVERNKQLAEMYDRLQAAQQQVVQSEKLAAVGQLAAGIVHDVKNPLGVIKGMAEELMLDAEEMPELEQGLKIIRDNASRANLIVTDLLKFARQSTPTMQQRDLRETIHGCLRLTDYLIRKGKVNAQSDVPEAPVWVIYDSQQIEQVLINLIQNAVQAMPEGGELNISLKEVEGEVELTVVDSGEGISEENLSRIFEPFFTTKPEAQGTGMGLAVSYGIISRHGGRIDVDSAPGEGSTFTIYLPKQPQQEPQGAEVAA